MRNPTPRKLFIYNKLEFRDELLVRGKEGGVNTNKRSRRGPSFIVLFPSHRAVCLLSLASPSSSRAQAFSRPPSGGSPRNSGRGAGIFSCQGTSLRLATRPWALSTGEYGGSRPPAKPGAPAAVARTALARQARVPQVDRERPCLRSRLSLAKQARPKSVQSGGGTRFGGNRRYWFPGS